MSDSADPSGINSNREVQQYYEEYMMPIWKSLHVPIKSAEGSKIKDFDGETYIDLLSGIAVTNAGHSNENINTTAKEQFDDFVHGCTYVHPHKPAALLSKRLSECTPGDLQKSFFANSGTEAVEGAIKLARKFTGKKEIVSTEMAFHGRTFGSLALTGNKSYKQGMAPTLNDVSHFAPPYSYRCAQCDGDLCGAKCANDLERVINTHTSGDVAAVVVEPILGEGGIIPPSKEWLARVREITLEHDALLIADEVQTGYGRTGEFWACDYFELSPDILVQAKGIANGLPLGAFTAREEIANAFTSGDHLSTFGGNPVSCAAALETINQLQSGIIQNCREQGEWLRHRLDDLEDRHVCVGEVRGAGLMQGIEIVDPNQKGPMGLAPAPDPKTAKQVGRTLRENGVVLSVGGIHKNVLRIQPSLSITRSELSDAIGLIEDAISAHE